MKKLTIILALVMVLSATRTFAQDLKFGHINLQELIALTPERDSAVVKMDNYGKELEETLQGMQQEFQTRYQTYNQKSATWTAAVLEAKTKELQDLQARIQEFQQNAQNEFSQMQQELMTPIIKKAAEAIEKVGKEQGFIYIFDLSVGGVAFKSANSIDVLPLAKQIKALLSIIGAPGMLVAVFGFLGAPTRLGSCATGAAFWG
jgi:outer membrane protein